MAKKSPVRFIQLCENAKVFDIYIYTLYLYILTLLSQILVSWIPRCIKVRLKLEKTSFDSKMNIYINVFCKCIIDDGHKETSESLKF